MIDFATASRLLAFDGQDGVLRWKARDPSEFGSPSTAARWNTRYAGHAIGCRRSDGYLVMSLFDRRYLVHRVVWLLLTGEWPSGQIDHQNHDRADNRSSNLRAATHAENGRNQRLRATNKSGHNGVRQRADTKRWTAEAQVGGRSRSLGCFASLDEAVAARRVFDRSNHYHPNHGARQ